MQHISQCFQWVIYVSQQTDNTDTTQCWESSRHPSQIEWENLSCHSETSFSSEQHTAETCPDSEKILYEDVKKA